MSYELSFSDDFFYGIEDFETIFSNCENQIEKIIKPKSVLESLIADSLLNRGDFLNMIIDLIDPKFSKNEYFFQEIPQEIFWALIDKIKETNECRNLNSPVEVYIDSEHNYSIFVYD